MDKVVIGQSFLQVFRLSFVSVIPTILNIFPCCNSPFGPGPTRQDSCALVISSSQRPLSANPQERDIHAFGGVRTRHPRKRAAADPRCRQLCSTLILIHVLPLPVGQTGEA